MESHFTSITENWTNGTSYNVTWDRRKSYWALILILIPSFTLFGNLLVIVSVITRRSLRSPINYFILGLAVADMCVALAIMPFAVYVEFNENWELGTLLCDLYCAGDVTCSTASIFLLTVISFDRYVAATQPIRYANSAKGITRVAVINLAVWLVSMLIASPMVLGLNNVPNRDMTKCMFYNADFIIYSSTGSFCIPLVIILYLYARIYCVIRQRGKLAQQRQDMITAATRGSVIAADMIMENPMAPPNIPAIVEATEKDDQDGECPENVDDDENEGNEANSGNENDYKNFLLPASQAVVGVAGIRCSLLKIRRTASDADCDSNKMENETNQDRERTKESSQIRMSKSMNGFGGKGGDFDAVANFGEKCMDFGAVANFGARGGDFDAIANFTPTLPISKCCTPAGTVPEIQPFPSILVPQVDSERRESMFLYPITDEHANSKIEQLTPSPNHKKRRSTNISFCSTLTETTVSETRKRASEIYIPAIREATRFNSFLLARIGGKRSMDDTAQRAKARWLRRLSTRLVLWRFHRDRTFSGAETTMLTLEREGIKQPLLLLSHRRFKSPRKSVSKTQRKEKKATKTLAVVLGIFLICWLPFFTLNLLNAFCMKLKIPQCQMGFLPFFLTTWLGYTNSLMNPIIYTIFNADFRRAFREILCSWSGAGKRTMRRV